MHSVYHSHWGFQQPPFPSGPELHKFFEGSSQREALARLHYLTENHRRLGLLLGKPGMGKSSLLQVFAEQCRKQGYAVAFCDLLGLTVREFYWQLGSQLAAPVRVEDDVLRLYRQVSDHLQQNRMQNVGTVLLLDNTDRMGADVATQLERLGRWLPGREGLLSLILAADSERAGRMNERLLDLLDLNIEMEPWDELDTTGYLQHALFEAGAERPLFDDGALSEIYRMSAGVPRLVIRLAEHALLSGSRYGQEIVDSATVQSVNESVSLPHPV